MLVNCDIMNGPMLAVATSESLLSASAVRLACNEAHYTIRTTYGPDGTKLITVINHISHSLSIKRSPVLNLLVTHPDGHTELK